MRLLFRAPAGQARSVEVDLTVVDGRVKVMLNAHRLVQPMGKSQVDETVEQLLSIVMTTHSRAAGQGSSSAASKVCPLHFSCVHAHTTWE
jgi:hypothetical protein